MSGLSGVFLTEGNCSYIFGNQGQGDSAAFHKINTIPSVIKGQRILLVDDSLVRNTQLRWLIKKIGRCCPKELTLGLACAPLIEICPFEESTRKREELAARRAMAAITGQDINEIDITPYLDPQTAEFKAMVKWIRCDVNKETELEVVKSLV